jgi:hypothetical protein
MRTIMKWGGVAVLVGVASLSIAWAEPQDRSPRTVTHRWVQQFGMVTPANGQTLRLHVVHLGLAQPPDPITPGDAQPPDPISPPDPCRVVLAFYNSAGRMIGNPDFKTLEGGEAAFIDLGFEARTDAALPPGPCRASVWVLQTVNRGQAPPDPCKATLEVLDTASGRASVQMLPAVQRSLPAVQ